MPTIEINGRTIELNEEGFMINPEEWNEDIARILAKEEEGNRRIAELKIQSLQATIDKQAQQIASLSAQLDAVVKQSQSLAAWPVRGLSRESIESLFRAMCLR